MGLSRILVQELSEESNLLQTAFWARFKSEFGHHPEAFYDGSSSLLVLSRKIKFFGWISYIPHAPAPPSDNSAVPETNYLKEICRELLPRLEKQPFVIRVDLPWDEGSYNASALNGLKKSISDVQVPHTVLVPLKEDDDTRLAAMKQKTRYNIRLGVKKGVEVVQAPASSLKDWYSLHEITAKRDKISIRSFSYYKRLFELAADYPEVDFRLYLARHEGDLLAGIIVAHHGRNASYLYGASSNIKRNLMPAYALQWQAMKDAKQAGCLSYDLCGIPESDDPDHPKHGLWRFKTGFGGTIVHRPGCMDYPVQPFIYNLARKAEKMHTWYHHVWRKR